MEVGFAQLSLHDMQRTFERRKWLKMTTTLPAFFD